MTRWLLALLALLVFAPSAHADGRFVHAFDATSEIQSTGNGFAWTTADGRVRVTDARGRTLYDVQPGTARHTPSATRGVALIVCGPGTAWLLDTRTGAVTSLPVPGEARRIGSFWIESGGEPAFTNWHTGGQRQLAAGADQRDLDDPELGIAQRPYRVRGSTLLVRRGNTWRAVAVCRAECEDIHVWRRRVAYVDGNRLIERRPRHTRRWHIPPALRGATLHRARNALVLQRGAQVWRAER